MGDPFEEIQRRAYDFYLREDAGSPDANWRRAELEVQAARVDADPGAARLASLLREQRDAMLAHEAGVRDGIDPEHLHQHRVAARRARAFLRAARASLDPEWRDSLDSQLRELGRLTGPVRDLDVLAEHVAAERGALPEEEQTEVDGLLARLAAECEEPRSLLLGALGGPLYAGLLVALGEPPRLAAGVESIPLDEIAARQFRRLRNAVRRLGDEPADEDLHALRIAVKRSRYAAELAGRGEPARERFLAAARRLQTLLGEHQDAAVAEQRLRTIAAADPSSAFVAGRLAERQGSRRERVRARLPRAWQRLRKAAG